MAVALAVIAAGATGWIVWDRTGSDEVRNGKAFGEDGASATIGMTAVRKGEDVWYLCPSIANLSDAPLTLESVTPAHNSPGLESVDARVYRPADFHAGLPLTWGSSSGTSANPGLVPSRPVQDTVLGPGQEMDDVIYLHLRVTTDRRPLESNGVAVEYRQKGKRYRQVLPNTFRLG
ncbi:hypothetical protein BWI15_02485 [Kribbella sp. ALI-6-A]|nr:hypothetical protein BWI15_02485 [Kribbella sp. ALI-6-A]